MPVLFPFTFNGKMRIAVAICTQLWHACFKSETQIRLELFLFLISR
jgi:hypothetical protein